MSNELKNCPKCNSRAIDFMRDRNGMWHVKCFRCGFTYIDSKFINEAGSRNMERKQAKEE